MVRYKSRIVKIYANALIAAYKEEKRRINAEFGHMGHYRMQREDRDLIKAKAPVLLNARVDPVGYVVWLFSGYRKQADIWTNSRQTARKDYSVRQLLSDEMVKRYLEGRLRFRDRVAHLKQALAGQFRTLELACVEILDDPSVANPQHLRAEALTCHDGELTPLFCYCMADRYGLKKVMEVYRDSAQLQYTLDAEAYERAWQDAELLPADWKELL